MLVPVGSSPVLGGALHDPVGLLHGEHGGVDQREGSIATALRDPVRQQIRGARVPGERRRRDHLGHPRLRG
jgi:hypothetical protein